MKMMLLTLLGLIACLSPAAGLQLRDARAARGGRRRQHPTPFIWVEDDDGNLHKAYLSQPDVAFAPTKLDLAELVKFTLYTKQSPTNDGENLMVDDLDKLQASTFNHEHPTKILIHGFMNTIRSSAIQEPKKAYLEHGEYNVIGVDWGSMCQAPWYGTAKANTMFVGPYVGDLVRFLVDHGGANYDHIHIIGHSLGGHIAGLAGKSLTPHQVARVTGLDPAGPMFYTSPPEERLQPTDAKFVDAIHTCGGYSLPQLGLMLPTAMADFYPNGGVSPQPGCTGFFKLTCSHSKVYQLWSDSVKSGTSTKFKSLGCTALEALGSGCETSADAVMGEHSPHTIRGIFWLSTD